LEIKEAIDRAKNNDQAAFKFILHLYWNDVYGFQLKRTQNENDAEDITIQTFSKAFDKIRTYKSKYQFKTWLITISKNLHLDLIRRRKATINQTISTGREDNYHSIPDQSPSPEDKLIREQNFDKLKKDIKKLKPHYQEVINLRYFHELSYNEISEKLDQPLNNIKVKLLRAKKLLSVIIKNPNEIQP